MKEGVIWSALSETSSVQPVEARICDVAPPFVDGQRVPAAFELLELRDRLGMAVLLERCLRRDIRDGVISRSGEEQKRSAGWVAGIDRRL
jgi:hypothetical protein